MSGMTPERLAMIEGRIAWATEGPWAPWLDQDGQPHMHGLLMVGNADAVIPEGEAWVEGVDVNPVAHTYTPEDRQFIAHARTDMPDLLAEVKRLRAGIEAFIDNPTWHRGMYGSPFDMVRTDDLRALLNPTEQAGSAA